MPNLDTKPPYIPRRLTRVDSDGKECELSEEGLSSRPTPIVILGEPGMGKTRLLESLAGQINGKFVRASALVRNPSHVRSDTAGQILVIDALDEVAALQEGDPLHNVLKALGAIDYPPFILSCRAAGWRSASSKIDIGEDYSRIPEEWTLAPITREEAVKYLVHAGATSKGAEDLIRQLDEKHLSDFYGNPLTLGLLSVRRQGFWNRWLRDLEEGLAHLFVDFKRLDCGIANAVV